MSKNSGIYIGAAFVAGIGITIGGMLLWDNLQSPHIRTPVAVIDPNATTARPQGQSAQVKNNLDIQYRRRFERDKMSRDELAQEAAEKLIINARGIGNFTEEEYRTLFVDLTNGKITPEATVEKLTELTGVSQTLIVPEAPPSQPDANDPKLLEITAYIRASRGKGNFKGNVTYNIEQDVLQGRVSIDATRKKIDGLLNVADDAKTIVSDQTTTIQNNKKALPAANNQSSGEVPAFPGFGKPTPPAK